MLLLTDETNGKKINPATPLNLLKTDALKSPPENPEVFCPATALFFSKSIRNPSKSAKFFSKYFKIAGLFFEIGLLNSKSAGVHVNGLKNGVNLRFLMVIYQLIFNIYIN